MRKAQLELAIERAERERALLDGAIAFMHAQLQVGWKEAPKRTKKPRLSWLNWQSGLRRRCSLVWSCLASLSFLSR